MNNYLIIGATSAIAQACARVWLQNSPGSSFVLTGRDSEKLEAVCGDLEIRGAGTVKSIQFDINDGEARASLVAGALSHLSQLDVILVAPGSLPNQECCQQDEEHAIEALETNAISIMLLLERLATQLETQSTGRLVIISSVAGDRGRMSNYYYGAAKAAVTAFASGMMMRLQKSGVSVSIVKPGFVKTPMTAGLELPEKLVATPDKVAAVVVKGADKGKGVIYAPGVWLIIMMIIRLIPTFIFRRLSL